MNWLLATVMAAISAGLSYAILNKNCADRIRLFNAFSATGAFASREMSSIHIWLGVILIGVSSFAAMAQIALHVSHWVNVWKLSVSLLCLVGSACFDYRERRIPNLFPLVLALCGVVLYGIGFAVGQPGAVAYLTTGAVATVLCALMLVLAAVLTKQGIGAGDIKLMCALALTTGIDVLIGVLCFSIVSCCVVGIAALAMKRKTLQDSLPFGPFIYFGFILTILVLNY